MIQCGFIPVLLFLLYPGDVPPGNASGDEPAHQIVAIAEKILYAFERMENFSCDIEAQYFRMGKEDKKYCFSWSRGKKGITRISFSRPYPGLTAIYKSGDKDVTIQPFAFLPFVKLRLSLYHPLLRSPSGQRMDQASVEYLSRYFYNNINLIQQHENSFLDETERVAISFWATDYTGGKKLNRYYVTISKDSLLPMQIDRYDGNLPIEAIRFKNFVIDVP